MSTNHLTLKDRITSVLVANGFIEAERWRSPKAHQPGAFRVNEGVSANVITDWEGVTREQRTDLLAKMATPLRQNGLIVELRDSVRVPHLYVKEAGQ